MSSDPETLARRLAAVEDHIAVEQLLYGIASAIDRYDGAALTRLIDPAARIDMGGDSLMTGASFAAAIRRPDQPRPGRMHVLSNVRIAFAGDKASSESQITSWQDQLAGGERVTRVRAGRYLDAFVRGPAGWQLVARTLIDEWSRIDPVGDTAPQGRHLGRPAPDDLLYRDAPELKR